MKLGYISSSIFRHTFEINEVVEILKRQPDTRVYSFYRPGREQQTDRLRELNTDIITWNADALVRAFFYLLVRCPLRLMVAGIRLKFGSLRNPIYWFKNFAVFFPALVFIADAHRQGITHFHANFGSSPATIAWLAKQILGTSMSVTFHAFDIYAHALAQRDPFKSRKLRDADLVVSVHGDGLETLRRLVPDEPAAKFRVIHICVAFSAQQRKSPLAQPPLFVAAGNLHSQKGFDVLVRAVGILKSEEVPFQVRILGEGEERPNLEALIDSEGVRDRVTLPGYFQNAELARHLSEAAALVVPSRVTAGGFVDGIPTVMVEAWLAQTPVIASAVGGMSEVVVGGETALSFPPEDHGALARAIRTLLDTPNLAEHIAAGGNQVARSEFSPSENAATLLAAIENPQ